MSPDHRHRATEAFFGRRKGKTLRPAQAESMRTLLPRYRLDLEAGPPADMGEAFDADVSAIRLEIGFGGGEHFLHRAAQSPQTGFIGIEPFVNGMAKCISALAVSPRSNVRLYDDDATRLLDWLPAGSIDHIDLLYPDPWPKKKHWKRRFVSPLNLDRMVRVLRPGGLFCFASDIDSYVNWTLRLCLAHPDFVWPAQTAANWRTPFRDWPGTRYESKALREGRTPAYLTFLRN